MAQQLYQPLPCIPTNNSYALCRPVLELMCPPGLELLHFEGRRATSATSKCIWHAIYCKPNGASIERHLARAAANLLKTQNPPNGARVSVGFVGSSNIEGVYAVWRHDGCKCNFFEGIVPTNHEPRSVTVLNDSGRFKTSLLQFQSSGYHVNMYETPKVMLNRKGFLIAASTIDIALYFLLKPTLTKATCVAVTIGPIEMALISPGDNHSLEDEARKAIDRVGHKGDIEFCHITSWVNRYIHEEEEIEDEIDFDFEEHTVPFPSLDEVVASYDANSTIKHLLDAFKCLADDRLLTTTNLPTPPESPPNKLID